MYNILTPCELFNIIFQSNSAANTEFENTWKQLQASFQSAPPTSSTQGTTLSQAASVLPKVPSPTSMQSTDSQPTKIDVQSLFSQANKVQTEAANTKVNDNSGKPVKPASRVVSNDEFAAMFRSLEDVQIADEENKQKEDKPEVSKDLNIHFCNKCF